jgi:biopolymer transport protein ExbD
MASTTGWAEGGAESPPRLPESSSTLALGGGVDLEVTGTAIRVAGRPVVSLEAWASPGAGLVIQPLLDALQELKDARTRSALMAGQKPSGLGTLRLAVDREAPHGLVIRLAYTAGQAGLDRLLFAVAGPDGQPRAVTITLPRVTLQSLDEPGARIGPPGADAPQSLELTVRVERGGLVLSGAGGRIASAGQDPRAPSLGLLDRPGCAGAERPTAACLDLAGLTGLLTELKRAYPTERSILVMADPELRLGDLVGVLDAIRGSPEQPLFPEVVFAAGLM